jgi:hypothetical protein
LKPDSKIRGPCIEEPREEKEASRFCKREAGVLAQTKNFAKFIKFINYKFYKFAPKLNNNFGHYETK